RIASRRSEDDEGCDRDVCRNDACGGSDEGRDRSWKISQRAPGDGGARGEYEKSHQRRAGAGASGTNATVIAVNVMSLDSLMPLELEKKLYLDGIHLFNDHEFFEAHETWEDIWHMAYGLKHEFCQGMSQAAVALEHYRRWKPGGGVSPVKSYPPKVRNVPERLEGLNVK